MDVSVYAGGKGAVSVRMGPTAGGTAGAAKVQDGVVVTAEMEAVLQKDRDFRAKMAEDTRHQEKEEHYNTPAKLWVEYTSCYKTKARLEETLIGAVQNPSHRGNQGEAEGKGRKRDPLGCTRPIIPALAAIIMEKDNPAEVVKLYNKMYKWRMEVNMTMAEDSVFDGAACLVLNAAEIQKESAQASGDTYRKFPKGVKYFLQMWNEKKKQWLDWFYLASSQFEDAGVGVFTAREFRENVPLGVYIGETVHSFGVEGGKKPTQETIDKLFPKKDDNKWRFRVAVRDTGGYIRIVEPDMMERSLGPGVAMESCRLFMGLQFINDCVLNYNEAAKQKMQGMRDYNCRLEEDGILYASCTIKKDQELYCDYGYTDEGDTRQQARLEKLGASEEAALSSKLSAKVQGQRRKATVKKKQVRSVSVKRRAVADTGGGRKRLRKVIQSESSGGSSSSEDEETAQAGPGKAKRPRKTEKEPLLESSGPEEEESDDASDEEEE